MRVGALATPEAFNFATAYCIVQAFLVFFSISSMFRLMTYHVSFKEIDLSHLVTISALWEGVMIHEKYLNEPSRINVYDDFVEPVMPPTPTPVPMWGEPLVKPETVVRPGPRLPPGSRRYNSGIDPDDDLNAILESYITKKTPAVHLYSGMFDSRFVLHEKVQMFLEEKIRKAFPWTLHIESLDSIVLVYSMGLASFSILFFTINRRRSQDTDESENEQISTEHINGDLKLFDSSFWILYVINIFLIIEMTTPISNPFFSTWQAVIYVTLMYSICSTVNTKRESKVVLIGAWSLHAAIMTTLSHASINNGGITLMVHVLAAIFIYISTLERVTIVKFINMRIWCAVLLNFGFMIGYVWNVDFISMESTY